MTANTPPSPNSAQGLTDSDHANMDVFLGQLLDGFKAGTISKEDAMKELTHVITAIDCGNHGEASRAFKKGCKITPTGR